MTDPTSSDLLELAKDEPDAEVQTALLERAEALALRSTTMRATDLIHLAAFHVERASPDDASRCIDLALAHADGLWIYRNAAKLRLSMGGLEAARHALEQCEAAFAERSTAGYEWRLLAQGWAEDIGELTGAVRCLARATVKAESVGDHCSVAQGLHHLVGDGVGAREAMARAEEVALRGEERQAWWTIANTYSAMGDGERTRGSLEHGARLATTVDEHLVMASAWHSQFPGMPDVNACLVSAAGAARTAHDWLEVAEANVDYGGGAAAVRGCLEEAAKVSEEPSDDRRIARGFRQWLDDPETAAAIAPAGVHPTEVATACVPLDGWQADAGALFDLLRGRMTPELLSSIAHADYSMGADKNLAVLSEVVETGLVPHPLDWHPQEVLHLTRWGEGARVNHLEHAFACTLLCIEGTDVECSEADIVILLDSCIALGADAVAALVGLMVALVEGTAYVDEEQQTPYWWGAAALGLLIAAAAVDPKDARLAMLAELTLATESVVELFATGMRPSLWRTLAVELLAPVVSAQPEATGVQLIIAAAG